MSTLPLNIEECRQEVRRRLAEFQKVCAEQVAIEEELSGQARELEKLRRNVERLLADLGRKRGQVSDLARVAAVDAASLLHQVEAGGVRL